MSPTILSIRFRIRPVEADGSKCRGCGEPFYLPGQGLFLQVGKHHTEKEPLFVLCQSCSELTEGEL